MFGEVVYDTTVNQYLLSIPRHSTMRSNATVIRQTVLILNHYEIIFNIVTPRIALALLGIITHSSNTALKRTDESTVAFEYKIVFRWVC